MSRILNLQNDMFPGMTFPSLMIDERGVTSEYNDIELGKNTNTAGVSCGVTWKNKHYTFGGTGSGSKRITQGK